MKLIIPTVDEPDWGSEDKINDKPVPMTLSAVLADLTPGLKYTILKFESASMVPTSNFVESSKWTKSWQFVASGETHKMNDFDTIYSN